MKQFLLSFACLIALSLNAQDGPKVVVFNSGSEKEKPTVDRYNLLKISLLEPLWGDISFYYERILNQNVSIEAGIGITTSDYVSNFVNETNQSSTISLIGNSFGLGFRYYPYLAGDEFYFAPEFKYRYYHSLVDPDPQSSAPNDLENYTKVSIFRITVGYMYLIDDRIFLDAYAGLGLAQKNIKEYQLNYDGVTGTYNYISDIYRRNGINLTVGLKFGLNF